MHDCPCNVETRSEKGASTSAQRECSATSGDRMTEIWEVELTGLEDALDMPDEETARDSTFSPSLYNCVDVGPIF